MAIYNFNPTTMTGTKVTDDPAKPIGIVEQIVKAFLDPLNNETVTTDWHAAVSALGIGTVMLVIGSKLVYSMPKMIQPKDLGPKVMPA